MITAYLLLGSNMGNRSALLEKALDLLKQQVGPVTARSSVYSTEAWPANSGQQDYLNQAIEIETSLSATALLQTILSIEEQMGRKRSQKWEARIIDIDILFYGSEVINTAELTIPHPFLHERRFVLLPLAEIALHFVHPLLKKSVQKLLAQNTDKLTVTPVHK